MQCRLLNMVAVLMVIVGYAAEFVSLANLHWTSIPTVVLISLGMTWVRAWLRRGLATIPPWASVPEGYELSWIVHRALRSDWSEHMIHLPSDPEPLAALDIDWRPLTLVIEGNPKRDRWDMSLDAGRSSLPPRITSASDLYLVEMDRFRRCAVQGATLGFCQPRSIAQCDEIDTSWQAAQAMTTLQPDHQQLAIELSFCLRPLIQKFSDCPMILWKNGTLPWEKRDWQIDVRRHLGAKTTWIIPMSSDEDMVSLHLSLAFGLSLWTYSLGCWNVAQRQYNGRDLNNHEARLGGIQPA